MLAEGHTPSRLLIAVDGSHGLMFGRLAESGGRREYEAQPMMKVLEDMTPLRRTGRADELAAVASFLCCDEASYVTGVDVLVDGGACAAVGVLA